MNAGLNVDVDFKYASGFKITAAFSAESGTVTSLAGPSGSGKSTLLSLICGLLDPDHGRIEIEKRVLFGQEPLVNVKPWNRNIGLLFQKDTLFPHLTVRKNLLFGASPSTNSQWQLDDIVDAFEIKQLLDRKPGQLSGGQRDRVALGRTLLSQPEVLLLDEPLSSVEDSLRNTIFDFVQTRIADARIPTLLVSHDSNLLSRVTGPTLEMDSGMLSK